MPNWEEEFFKWKKINENWAPGTWVVRRELYKEIKIQMQTDKAI